LAVPFGLCTPIFRSGPVEPPPSTFNNDRDEAERGGEWLVSRRHDARAPPK
jgi:hypothetical protein